MPDPRLAQIDVCLRDVRRVVAVTGGKGGIGKTLVASILALDLARAGRRVGLLDLDLTGPCDHLVLGVEGVFPREEAGIVPPLTHGIHFMSITHFSGAEPAPLRGADVSNALIELLAITRWGVLDVLVIDMPPGLGDAALDTVRLLGRAEFLVVATAARVVRETVKRTLRLLDQVGVGVLGVVENMARDGGDGVEELAAEFGVPLLGVLPFDGEVEEAMGDAERLASTSFARALARVAALL